MLSYWRRGVTVCAGSRSALQCAAQTRVQRLPWLTGSRTTTRCTLLRAHTYAAGAARGGDSGDSQDQDQDTRSVRARASQLEMGRLGGTAPGVGLTGGMHPRDSLELELEAQQVPLLSRLRESASNDRASGLRRRAVNDARASPAPSLGGPLNGWQYLVAMCALSVVVCYADRSNISTAVLPMAEQFGWDKTFQGLVLSSFFSGYALTQVLGGQLADKLGGKVVLAAGVGLWSLFTLVTPEAAAAGTIPLIASRILLGVGEGVAFPSIHSLIARNVPTSWQSTAVGIVTAASYIGTALAFGISPLIITTLGWQWVFYLFAGMAVLWLPLWLPVQSVDGQKWQQLTRKDSGVDGRVEEGERDRLAAVHDETDAQAAFGSSASDVPVISKSAGGVAPASALSRTQGSGQAQADSGFWALLRRKEVWAICVAQYCQSWGMYGLLNWLPTFFKDYYGVEIADLAAYTLAPYIVQGGLGLMAGIIADKLLSKGWGVRPVRILLQSLGMLGPAACLMLAVSPVVGASPSVASSLITVGLGFSALTLGGVSASHLDVAPRHAGVVFGAGNTTATLAGLISVPVTGYLLQATGSWPLVFGITAAHYVVGTIIWAMWVGDKPLPEDADPTVKLVDQRA